MSGIDRIAAERKRHVEEEGFDAAHDRMEKPGALTMAAICYATMAASSPGMRHELRNAIGYGPHWPWEPQWFKPGVDNTNEDRIMELTKAGALIAAEIDRIESIPEEHRVQ